MLLQAFSSCDLLMRVNVSDDTMCQDRYACVGACWRSRALDDTPVARVSDRQQLHICICKPQSLNFIGMSAHLRMQVAIEPVRPADMPALVEGLRLLNRADPFVEVSVADTGEHVLGAAGEVHLETCVKDLTERFARVELRVSAPLVAFRESVLAPGEAQPGGSSEVCLVSCLWTRVCWVCVQV